MFEIKTVPKCPSKIFQSYQADEAFEIDITGRFEVKARDKAFHTTIYPFLHSDHLFDQLLGPAANVVLTRLKVP